jgi:hypothetical protein
MRRAFLTICWKPVKAVRLIWPRPRLIGLLAGLAMAVSAIVALAPPARAYVGPVSQSWYVTAADLVGSGGEIYNEGYNAPSGPQVVFLQAGQVCITSGGGSGFLTYGGGCQPTYNVAYAVQWWFYGFQQNPAHRGSGYVVLCVTTSNGTSSNTTDNYRVAAEGLYEDLVNQTVVYANYLNAGSPNAKYVVAGGIDAETSWDKPNEVSGWLVGWLNKRATLTTQLNFGTDGAYYGTCATSSCWNSPVDHGWAPSQMYAVYYGWPGANSYPQIYNNTWPAYYRELNQAAASAGKAQIPYTGVMWGCGTGGNEPSASQAYTDFVSGVHQSPAYVTSIHSLSKTC